MDGLAQEAFNLMNMHRPAASQNSNLFGNTAASIGTKLSDFLSDPQHSKSLQSLLTSCNPTKPAFQNLEQ